MKTSVLLLAGCFLLILNIRGMAGEITPGQAVLVAKNLVSERHPGSAAFGPVGAGIMETRTREGKTLVYVVGFSEMPGFVIVTASDQLFPVAGYSFAGSYYPVSQAPAFSALMQNLESLVAGVIENESDAGTADPLWQHYLADPFVPGLAPADIGPLVSSKWGQGCFYNASCPADPAASASCFHALAGCGATAMAQVMKYYSHPVHGTGEHGYTDPDYGIQYANFSATTYDWASMSDTLLANNDAVATLVYQCGVAQDMNYGTTVSTSGSGNIETAFKNYFGYPLALNWKWKDNFTPAAWENMLRAELDASHPLFYYGNNAGSDGHFFVCDGYQGTGFFHFNWGWDGQNDGYFYLNSLNPGMWNFTSEQGAIFDLAPNAPGPVIYTQDFESVEDFSLTFDPWTVRDMDGNPTYAIQDHTFPHDGSPMAYICFNPSGVTPPMTDPAIQPHGGDRFGACFSSDPPANNDWFISPQIQLDTSGEFSFWVKSYTSEYGLEKYRVGISTTDNDPASFTFLSGTTPLEAPETWTRKSFSLAAYNGRKVYLAIQCVSNNAFILMIDDLEIRTKASTSVAANFSADKTKVKAGEKVNFLDQSSGSPTTWLWTFQGGTPATSNAQNPADIRYNSTGTFDVTLTVSDGTSSDTETKSGYITVTDYPSSMSLDFESLSDFTLEFAPWTVNDVRGGVTWGIEGTTFPNSGIAMAYICFNPETTSPPLANMVAHSGKKLGCCFSSMPNKNPNNKWLITPRMSLGADPQIEFWVQSYNTNYGFEMYNVAVSTTNNLPASFTPVNPAPEAAPGTWTRRSYDLGAYANQDVFIGIQCVSDNVFIFMIDDISITSVVGMDEADEKAGISVYPNPASGHLNISCPGAVNQTAEVCLMNALGVTVRTIAVPDFSAPVRMDISGLPQGIYILRVSSGHEHHSQKITIVN